jgi:hypothetical protein
VAVPYLDLMALDLLEKARLRAEAEVSVLFCSAQRGQHTPGWEIPYLVAECLRLLLK